MNKNQQAIADYYIAHRDELLAFASSRLGDCIEAEDVVQNVFVRLLTTDKMISPITLPCLCYTITRNLINDYYRRHAQKTEYAHEFVHSQMENFSMEPHVFAAELTQRIEHCLKRVPENCREIYRMHIYGGMKVSEISNQLGENYKSVEYRLGTARREVRQLLRAAI